jgi:hypothetical protein
MRKEIIRVMIPPITRDHLRPPPFTKTMNSPQRRPSIFIISPTDAN